jgi:hypothetical protein
MATWFYLTIYITNTYVHIHIFRWQNRQVLKFDDALFFINTNYTQTIHFYIYGIRKVLNGIGISLMFTKNNIFVNKMNSNDSI